MYTAERNYLVLNKHKGKHPEIIIIRLEYVGNMLVGQSRPESDQSLHLHKKVQISVGSSKTQEQK